jgi:glycosyltransferase involved in cell wall biosynthesis
VSERRKVVLVSFFFPPEGGGGTQRGAKFAKYLPACGWDVAVLAADSSRQSLRGHGRHDRSLESDVRAAQVVRVPFAPGPKRRARIDRYEGWFEGAWPALRELIRDFGADALVISMSPFSLARLGVSAQAELGVPVVYDLRDPWTLDGWPTYRSRRQWARERAFMVETLSGAAGVVANTPEAARCIGAVVPGLDDRRMCVIPNGYDAEDFHAADPAEPDPAVFTIVHTGSLHSATLYPPRGVVGRLKRMRTYRCEPIVPEGRTARYLLAAVARLRAQGHPLASRVRVKLIGVSDDATKRCVEESGVADAVEMTGYVSHDESVRWLLTADALFLPLHDLPAGARSRIVPGKTYEYLASGRPILGCLPQGDARDLVERSAVGFCAQPCDVDAIATRLGEMLDHWEAGSLPCGPAPWVGEYERRALSARLAAFLDSVCPQRCDAGASPAVGAGA